MSEIKEKLFGGEKENQYNVLMQTLKNCAKDREQDIYDFLDSTPKTSLVVELVDEINNLGFEITKKRT